VTRFFSASSSSRSRAVVSDAEARTSGSPAAGTGGGVVSGRGWVRAKTSTPPAAAAAHASPASTHRPHRTGAGGGPTAGTVVPDAPDSVIVAGTPDWLRPGSDPAWVSPRFSPSRTFA